MNLQKNEFERKTLKDQQNFESELNKLQAKLAKKREKSKSYK